MKTQRKNKEEPIEPLGKKANYKGQLGKAREHHHTT